jgi:hypothetical protein
MSCNNNFLSLSGYHLAGTDLSLNVLPYCLTSTSKSIINWPLIKLDSGAVNVEVIIDMTSRQDPRTFSPRNHIY